MPVIFFGWRTSSAIPAMTNPEIAKGPEPHAAVFTITRLSTAPAALKTYVRSGCFSSPNPAPEQVSSQQASVLTIYTYDWCAVTHALRR